MPDLEIDADLDGFRGDRSRYTFLRALPDPVISDRTDMLLAADFAEVT
jgi:hypothetical protein